MKKASARWMTMASALVAITALNLACSSSNSSGGDAGGTGGKTDSGGGTGGKVDSGSDVQVTHALTYNFDNSVQGFTFNNGYGYAGPDDVNLAPPPPSVTDAATDAGAGDGGAPIPVPTITLDTVHGKPSAGSLQISVTFTACNQFVEPSL